jgi:hypothetical protein
MSYRIAALAALGVMVAGLFLPGATEAARDVPGKTPAPLPLDKQLAQKDAKVDLNDASLEVQALQAFHQIGFTPAQLKELAKLAKDTAMKPRERKEPKANEKFRTALLELRAALRKNDEDKIDDLIEKVDKLRDSEEPKLDDKIEVTEAARRSALEAIRLLGAKQLADYVVLYEDLPEPLAKVRETLKDNLKSKDDAWKKARDEAADEVGWLVGGFDTARVTKVKEQVTALLDKGHAWNEAELKKQQDELGKSMREIMGDVGPTEVLRHIVQRDLADLLSNPQLPAALELRLKDEK